MRIALLFILPALVLARAPTRFRDRDLALSSMLDFQTLPTLVSGTGGSAAADLNFPLTGTQSVRLTAGPSSTPLWIWALPSTNICNDSFIEVILRTPNQANTLNLSRIDLYIGNNLSNYRTYEFGSFDVRDTGITFAGEWTRVRFPLRRFTQVGTFSCATADTLAIGHRAQTATQDTVSIARVARFPKRDDIATLLLNEDDEWASWDTLAVPTLLAMGFPHDIAVNGGRVGVTNFINQERMRALCATGKVKFMNHGWMHDSITDLSLDSARGWFARNATFISSFGRSCDESRVGVLPFGKHNRAIDSAVRTWGVIDYMRTTKGAAQGEAQNFNSPFAMRLSLSFGVGIDTTSAKTLIDTLVAQRTTGIFLFHQICSACTPADANTWRQDWFISVMNYVQTQVLAGRLRVMHTGDYLQQYGGGFGPARRAGIGR